MMNGSASICDRQSTLLDSFRIRLASAPNTLCVEANGVEREVSVPPLSRIRVVGEVCASVDAARWPVLPLRSRREAGGVWSVPGAVQSQTVRLFRIEAGRRVLLTCGDDFELDSNFAGIVPRRKSVEDDAVYILDYDLRQQRVDVLATREGRLRLFVGVEDLVTPRWPCLPAGWMGLARIHSRFRDGLDESAIFPVQRVEHARLINYPVRSDLAARLPGGDAPEAPMDADSPLWTEVVNYAPFVTGSPDAFTRLRRRFCEARTFRLVYFGDSVTQGGDVRPDWRWTERFERYATGRAPDKALSFVNAAMGGTSSSFGRERFDRDVLAHRPDAVTILFALNDKKLDDRTFEANHRFFVETLRARHIEPILLTSNMNTAIWMNGLDHAEQRIRDFCREHDLICLDAYGIWKDLPTYGIPYETLLANGINHPDRVAAGVFFELIKRAFFEQV